jgi:hypothetical protein
VDSTIRSLGAWGLPAEAFEKRIADNWLDTGASLILISLLSLGLWAAMWGAVASLAAASGNAPFSPHCPPGLFLYPPSR